MDSDERDRMLPGMPAERVRTFDAPEAMGVRFHEVRAKSALNRVPGDSLPFNWTVNPFRGCLHSCVFCFARGTHRYLDMSAGRDFEREIVVKVNVPELLAAEVRKPRWKRELVAFGTNTDPYQWAEAQYELMPPMLDALREARTPVSVLTRSPLALRDLDRYRALAEVVDVSVNFSLPTLDEKLWRRTEPRSPHPMKRLEALASFRDAGIPSGVLVAPLMPGINDSPELVAEIERLATEAGATFIRPITLHLRPGTREVFMDWLSTDRPDLVPRYRDLYAGGPYAPASQRRSHARLVSSPGAKDRRRHAPEPRTSARAGQPFQPALFDSPPQPRG